MKHSTTTAPVETHWLVVVSADNFDRAVQEVGAFLAFQRARPSLLHGEHRRSVIGIWVDSTMVDPVPSMFGVGASTCHRQFRVRESVGVNGRWSLWGLDVKLSGTTTAPRAVRESLIATLAAIQSPRNGARGPQFVPVFGLEQHPSAIDLEMNRLRELFPRRIGDPVTWGSPTGAVLRGSGPRYDEP